jgi:hypothetical protein
MLIGGLIGGAIWWAVENYEEPTTEVPIGDGGTITVPSDYVAQPPKERVVTFFSSYMDSAGYASEVKQCVMREIEAVPTSEFQRIDQLKGSELTEAQLQLALGVSKRRVVGLIPPSRSRSTLGL